jgi:protein TonB
MVPVIRDDDLVTEEYTLPPLDEMDGKVISIETKDGTISGDNLMPDDIVTEYQVIKINDVVQKTEVFSFVEEMPSYPGGTEALLSFMSSNIIYPEIAKRAGVEGKVFVGFIVEPNGSITEIQLIKGIGAGCDEEAIRVLKLAGNWNPGRQNGKAVRVRMTIPFSFQLR